MELEELISKMASSSGKSLEDVRKLVDDKRERFYSMLSENGAALMVARELGVEVEGKNFTEKLEIKDLEPGMANVDLDVTVKQVFMPRGYERKGKKGEFVSMIVADKTGEVRLSVWNSTVKEIAAGNVRKAQSIGLHNCYVSEYNERIQLNLGFGGSLNVLEKEILNVEKKEKKVSDVLNGEELSEVDLLGKIVRVFPEREFTTNKDGKERKGRLTNFMLADESGEVRSTAWNDLGDSVRSLEGKVVTIESAYTKAGLREGNEVHLGYRSRIFRTEGFSSLGSLGEPYTEEPKKALDLEEGDKNVLLEGVIVDVPRAPSVFRVCPKCNSKVTGLEGKHVCGKCGQVEPKKGLAGSIELDDGSSVIKCIAFREQAEKLLGIKVEEVKEGEEARQETLAKARERLVTKKAKLLGNARMNSFDNKIELVVREVKEVEG